MPTNHLKLVPSGASSPKKYVRGDALRMNAVQRRRELRRLARYRVLNQIAIGSESAWADAIADALRGVYGKISAEMVHDEWAVYELPALSPEIVDHTVRRMRWGREPLLAAIKVGSALDLTSVEREEAGIFKIEAVDEPVKDRKRRLARERKARQRAAKAALAPKRKSKAELARELKVSRRTLYRMIAADTVKL